MLVLCNLSWHIIQLYSHLWFFSFGSFILSWFRECRTKRKITKMKWNTAKKIKQIWERRKMREILYHILEIQKKKLLKYYHFTMFLCGSRLKKISISSVISLVWYDVYDFDMMRRWFWCRVSIRARLNIQKISLTNRKYFRMTQFFFLFPKKDATTY